MPAVPARPNGLAMGRDVSAVCPGVRVPAMVIRTAPVTAAAATTRQRRERSRPLGSSRNGRVIPRVMAGAQWNSPGHGGELGSQGQRATAMDELVDPGVQGDQQRPDQPGGGVQPADRVVRPPQGKDQPDGGVPEREGQGEASTLDQHGQGERPGHDQGHQQPGRAATEGDQPQRPGQHAPAPGAGAHHCSLVTTRLLPERASQASGTRPLRPRALDREHRVGPHVRAITPGPGPRRGWPRRPGSRRPRR